MKEVISSKKLSFIIELSRLKKSNFFDFSIIKFVTSSILLGFFSRFFCSFSMFSQIISKFSTLNFSSLNKKKILLNNFSPTIVNGLCK